MREPKKAKPEKEKNLVHVVNAIPPARPYFITQMIKQAQVYKEFWRTFPEKIREQTRMLLCGPPVIRTHPPRNWWVENLDALKRIWDEEIGKNPKIKTSAQRVAIRLQKDFPRFLFTRETVKAAFYRLLA